MDSKYINPGSIFSSVCDTLSNWYNFPIQIKDQYYWLPECVADHDNTWTCLNLSWPSWNLQQNLDNIPNQCNTVVLSFHLEYTDFEYVDLLCKSFPDKKILLIHQFSNCFLDHPNLTVLQYDCYPMYVKTMLEYGNITLPVECDKKYKISSLSNRITQYKSYVTAYFLKKWKESDTILSWNNNLGSEGDLYLLDKTGFAPTDNIIDYIKEINLLEKQIKFDGFYEKIEYKDVYVFQSWNFPRAVYSESLINATNESWNHSYGHFNNKPVYWPGPYLTEKTWKPLLCKTAVFPIGQCHTYKFLNDNDFKFEYPWDISFDDDFGDLTRFGKIMQSLDQINELEFDDIKNSILDSGAHNQEHILSNKWFDNVKRQNEKNIQQCKF